MITTEIKIQNAINWIEALLSGKYPQGKYKLGDDKIGYCCWGLGCKIVNLGYSPSQGWNMELNKHIGFINNTGNLHTNLLDFSALHQANDNGVSFYSIARHLVLHADEQFEHEVAVAVKEHFKDIKA